MPVKIIHDSDKNIIRATITGQPTLVDLDAAFQSITTSTEYPPDVDAIWDLRDADVKTADDKFVRHIIELLKRYPQRARCKSALIATDDLAYGMSRMFQILSEDKVTQELMIFRTYAEGEQWICRNRPAS
jgi:hypothetical protein